MSKSTEILDYADPNRPTDFWRKKNANKQLYALALEAIGKDDVSPITGNEVLIQHRIRNRLREEQRNRLAVLFGVQESKS